MLNLRPPVPGAAGVGEQRKLALGLPQPPGTGRPSSRLGPSLHPVPPAEADAQPGPGFSAPPTHASCGSTAAGPSWAWPARCRCAARRPGPRGDPPGCAVWRALSQAGGRCSEREPHARGWRAEGAELLAAAGEGPGRTCRHPCRGRGAVGGSGAEGGSRVSGCSHSHSCHITQLSARP